MELKCISFVCFELIFLKFLKAEEIFVGSTYTFQSENYPSPYPKNYNGTWCFVADSNSKLNLTFDELETEETFDFINVYERTNVSSHFLLLRWTGSLTDETPRVVSSGNNLCLSLETDSAVNKKGFRARVKPVGREVVDVCANGFDCGNGVCLKNSNRCDGFVNCGNGEDEMCTMNISVSSVEEFSSMIYVDECYTLNHHFVWYLNTSSDMGLELEFTDLHLEESYDFLFVGEGMDISSNPLVVLHGRINNSTFVRSPQSNMWVRIRTDESNNERGFVATARSINRPEIGDQCNGSDCGNGVCISGTALDDKFISCRNEESCGGIKCLEGKCISEERLCDGEPHCSTDEDESGCESTVTVTNRWTRTIRNFSHTIIFTNSVPSTHLLINFIFLWTEGRNVDVNLAVGEDQLTSPPLLQRNGIIDEYVLTERFSADDVWVKFSVKGALVISVNPVNEAPTQSSCPDDIIITDEDGPAEWNSPRCSDLEDGELVSTCSHASGENLPEEENTVTCTCMDSLNSTTSCNFTVTRKPPEVAEFQIVPLVIGLTVTTVLILLLVLFFVMTRQKRQGNNFYENGENEERVPIGRMRNSVERDGITNPDIQPYSDERGLGSRTYESMKDPVGEGNADGPGLTSHGASGNDDQMTPYSQRLYQENRPIPPSLPARDNPYDTTVM